MELRDRIHGLISLLEDLEGAVVAYSGGADSAFLMEAAHRSLGDRALAVTAVSPSLPGREMDEASSLASLRGWSHRLVDTSEIEDERYASNPPNRCYFCKNALMERLRPISAVSSWPILVGTNVDDLGDWRPGQSAAAEAGALFPLVDTGFGKADVRKASALWGLPTSEKPAAACLASRFAYGVRVSAAGLARVEKAEDWLIAKGYSSVRVRDLGSKGASVEVAPAQVRVLIAEGDDVSECLMEIGFSSVSIDEVGYRQGAMNEVLSIEGSRPA